MIREPSTTGRSLSIGDQALVTGYLVLKSSGEGGDGVAVPTTPSPVHPPMQMTRRSVGVRASLLAGVGLAACGAGDDLPGVPRIGTSPGKVIYATWGEVGPRESEHWSLLNFEKNYTDLRIDIITALDQASYVNRLEALISSGTDPDVMRVPGQIAHNIYARGAALRLDGLVKRDGFRPDHLAPPYDVGTFKRNWYGFPRSRTASWVVFHNRAWFGRIGIADPLPTWTWDDFLGVARRLTGAAPDGGGWGTAIEPMASFPLPWFWGVGGDDIDRDGAKPQLDTPMVREALGWIMSLRETHRVAPPAGVVRDIGDFAAGRVAMWFGNADDEMTLRRIGAPDFGISPQPKGRVAQIGGYQPDVIAIGARAANPDDGWELLQFLVDPDTQRLEFEQGLWLPQSKSITDAAAYRTPVAAPHDRRAAIPGVLLRVRTPNLSPATGAMRRAVGEALTPFWDGRASLESVIPQAMAVATQVMAKGE